MKPVLVRSFVLFALVLFFTRCGRRDKTINGYSPKDNFYYKLISLGDGKIKPDTADYLWVDAACYTLKDSVFWDTRHDAGQGFFVRHHSFLFARHLYTLSEGDSAQYLLPTAVFYRELFNFPVPFFSKNDSAVKFSVRVLKILSQDEYGHINDSLHAARQQRAGEEYAQVYNYITQHFKKSIEFSKDAFLEKSAETCGDSVKWGRKVTLAYKGYFLDGRLADYTPPDRPFEFRIGQEGQLIDGLRLALYHLRKGEKAKIILPSRLAFGSLGNSNGSIAPYTPLLYEVQVLDVKKEN
jgi:FKBP-type peptidyl-prolyl cis-trans isomerase